VNPSPATASNAWSLPRRDKGREVLFPPGEDHEARGILSASVGAADRTDTMFLVGALPRPCKAISRPASQLVDFVLRVCEPELQYRFLVEVVYAAAEAVAQNDLWIVAEVLQGWEADAEISAYPEFAAQVGEALSEYQAGDKGRPWDEIARELGLSGELER